MRHIGIWRNMEKRYPLLTRLRKMVTGRMDETSKVMSQQICIRQDLNTNNPYAHHCILKNKFNRLSSRFGAFTMGMDSATNK
jgi:hypothetical protein